MNNTPTVKESLTAQLSNTPRTDKLFFPHGRDHTAAAEPSLLVCMTQYELLERENATLRDWGEPVAWCWMDEEIGFGLPPDAVSQEATLLYAKKEEGK
jgi:hypothetical protein